MSIRTFQLKKKFNCYFVGTKNHNRGILIFREKHLRLLLFIYLFLFEDIEREVKWRFCKHLK